MSVGESSEKRTFLAVFPPGDVIQELAGLIERVRRPGDGVSWVRPTNLHYTLRFLGDLGPGRVEAASRAAAESVRGLAPFEASLGSTGAFPNLRRPRVLWIGLEVGAESLELFARSLDEALSREGFDRPDRPFQAHLTLGRLREPERGAVGHLAERLSGEHARGRFTVRTLTVIHSTLDPKGSIYRPLAEYELTARAATK